MKPLHVIVACAENRVIGRAGKLPWRIPEDVEHFSQLTAGNVCVLGRVCFDTWPEATRQRRQPIVLTSRPLPNVGGVTSPRVQSEPHQSRGEATPPTTEPARESGHSVPLAARSLADALALAETISGEAFVCGGQRVFEETLALNRPMQLHLTLVHAEVTGDRFFPEWRHLAWRELDRCDRADANFRYTFLTLERVV